MTQHPEKLTLCELADTGLEGVESYSPFCLKAHRALRYAGLSYERRFGRAPADFKDLNPSGQVPVLVADGKPIADSTNIVQQIDAWTGALSRDLDARQQAEAWLWEEYADTSLSGFVVSSRWAFDENWPAVRATYFAGAPWFVHKWIVPQLRKKLLAVLVARDVWRRGRDACWQRYLKALDDLNASAPETGFWVSATVSVADLGIFAQLQSLRTPLTPGHAAELAKRSRLSAYVDRVDRATRHANVGALRIAQPNVPRAQMLFG